MCERKTRVSRCYHHKSAALLQHKLGLLVHVSERQKQDGLGVAHALGRALRAALIRRRHDDVELPKVPGWKDRSSEKSRPTKRGRAK